jgi:nucleoside-diphosphate-sugar epimerase
MKTVLITGAAGYIGSVLTNLVRDEGYKVIALDRLFFGRDKLPADCDNLKVVEGDIRFVEPGLFKNVAAVIDLAALSNDPAGELDPIKTYSINHLGRTRVAALAKAAGVSRYILPSSCSIYGFQDGMVDETSAVNPLTTYAKANYNVENDVLAMADDTFTVTVIRQATVYGASPRMRFDLAINGMVKGFLINGKIPILKDGNQWRPFVHVRDTSRAMCLLLKADRKLIQKQMFNIGSDEQNYQIFDLARRVAKSLNMEFQYAWYGDPDHRSYRVSFEKVKKLLGYTPEFNAEKGAQEVAEGMRNGILNPDDPTTITVQWYKKLLNEGVML